MTGILTILIPFHYGVTKFKYIVTFIILYFFIIIKWQIIKSDQARFLQFLCILNLGGPYWKFQKLKILRNLLKTQYILVHIVICHTCFYLWYLGSFFPMEFWSTEITPKNFTFTVHRVSLLLRNCYPWKFCIFQLKFPLPYPL